MKILLPLLLFLFSVAYGQEVTIKEMKFKPNPASYNSTAFTIVFPVVVTGNVQVDQRINARLKNDFFQPDDEKRSLKSIVLQNIYVYGLINLSYEVTFESHGILSLSISAEGCGAHCSSWQTWFNFDLHTGKKIVMEDLLLQNRMDSFKNIVFNDKTKALISYKKEEENNLKNNETDSETYHWAIDRVDDCIKSISFSDFSFSATGLEINDGCEFPNAIRSQQPSYELKYPYSFLAVFFNQRYKKIFLR